jgi:hypothetical protein
MPVAEAEKEAAGLVVRNKQALQLQQARKDYERYGYIKIFSTVLNQVVYLVRDQSVAIRVPDLSLPVFTESELKCLQGLEPDEAKLLMESKIIYGGTIRSKEELEKLKDSPKPVRRKKLFKRTKYWGNKYFA